MYSFCIAGRYTSLPGILSKKKKKKSLGRILVYLYQGIVIHLYSIYILIMWEVFSSQPLFQKKNVLNFVRNLTSQPINHSKSLLWEELSSQPLH